jgi:anti-anti-sigma factor
MRRIDGGRAPGRPGFSISEAGERSRRRLSVAGEIDLLTAPQLEESLSRLCAEGVSEIEVDLREVDFIDSSGLRAILSAKANCAERGVEFRLVPSMRTNVRRSFEVSGVFDRLRRRTHS